MRTGRSDIFPDLSSDCSSCAALCCIALHLDAGESFAINKDAGVPCPNLRTDDFGCAIHGKLAQEGYSGCVRYECLGAGQRTIQEIYKGETWHSRPELLGSMMESFRILRRLHEALEILSLLDSLKLNSGQQKVFAELLALFTPPEEGWSPESLARLENCGAFTRFKSMLHRFQSAAMTPNALAAPGAAS